MLPSHLEKVAKIQKQMRALLSLRDDQSKPISISKQQGEANTARSKAYKNGCQELNLGKLDEILHIDTEKRIAHVEPRVTMEQLVKATLAHGLIFPVVPEFKGITVGGAIMGGAAESGSHRWGSFNDACLSFEILCGNGEVVHASPDEHADLFYGISCSYGSLGVLLSVEIALIPAQDWVHLKYHVCSSPQDAIATLKQRMQAQDAPDFLDGIVFSRNLAVIIEGQMKAKESLPEKLPRFSVKPIHAEWYFQHVENRVARSQNQEAMSIEEYLFRFDQGGFWVGAYLFRLQFLARFVFQGILKLSRSFPDQFSEKEIQLLHAPPRPNAFWRFLTRPLMSSQRLWKLHHLAETWVQNHAIVQDFCIPEHNASQFLEEVSQDPGTFPLWLCPIKSSLKPQFFAPHFTTEHGLSHLINIGIYGLPCYYGSIEEITKKLELKTRLVNGRKVFYSKSYYTQDEFWRIYSKETYELLRTKWHARGIWHEITKKLLS